MHAQDEDWQSWKLALDVLEDIDTAADTEAQVENDDIDWAGAQGREQFVARGRFLDDGKVVCLRDDLSQASSDDRVVVGNGDSRHGFLLRQV
jgi:hypothetical protein